MTFTYTEKLNELGKVYIERLDSERPESISYIPLDLGNSDYQAYLRWLNGEEENGTIS